MESISFAISILTRAVTLDTAERYTESLVCYQEGLQILIESLKKFPDGEEERRKKLRVKVQEYMERAEKLKVHIENLKRSGSYREQIQIEEDSINHSYHSVFSRFLDETVRRVEIDDSYIRAPHQCDNFLRFTELLVRHCPNLQRILLTTSRDLSQYEQQKARLLTISTSLRNFSQRNIELAVIYSDSIHDREVRLDNGWVIKIGRGLDYFKPLDKFNIGWSDFDLRPCKETKIDIFHRKDLVSCH